MSGCQLVFGFGFAKVGVGQFWFPEMFESIDAPNVKCQFRPDPPDLLGEFEEIDVLRSGSDRCALHRRHPTFEKQKSLGSHICICVLVLSIPWMFRFDMEVDY